MSAVWRSASNPSNSLLKCLTLSLVLASCRHQLLQPDAHTSDARVLRQVFEYLTTDLKKYMDRNGKGPSNPMHPDVIKVGTQEAQQRQKLHSVCHARLQMLHA